MVKSHTADERGGAVGVCGLGRQIRPALMAAAEAWDGMSVGVRLFVSGIVLEDLSDFPGK